MSDKQFSNGKDPFRCVYNPDSHQELSEVLRDVKHAVSNLNTTLTQITTQLIGPATNKGYIPVETHNRVLILTVLIFGGVELIKYLFVTK